MFCKTCTDELALEIFNLVDADAQNAEVLQNGTSCVICGSSGRNNTLVACVGVYACRGNHVESLKLYVGKATMRLQARYVFPAEVERERAFAIATALDLKALRFANQVLNP